MYMIEQWFLDLDGVRSGPYQTPEVMSLIAEGEVLPHHRISTSLREQRWVTILDWRLDQAKISQNPSPSPFTKSRSEVSSVEGLEEVSQTAIEIPEELITPTPPPLDLPTKIEPEKAAILDALPTNPPDETNRGAASEKVSLEEDHPNKNSSENAAAGFEVQDEPVHTPPAHTQAHTPTPMYAQQANAPLNSSENPEPKNEARPKRDPMAEMFDMLQNTKQKRDAKAPRNDSSISMEHDESLPQKTSGLVRTLMIGGGITLIGFALGQIFQQAAPPKDPSAVLAKPSPFASVTPAAHAAAPTNPSTEVIDRSNEKLTIRAAVDRKAEANPSPVPNNKIGGHALHSGGSADNPQNEKEIEELKNLKKELQELKALKNSQPDEDMEMPAEGESLDAKDPGMDPAYRYEPGTAPKGYPNNNTTTYPSEGDQQPAGAEQPGNR
jgi:hypothetical protein